MDYAGDAFPAEEPQALEDQAQVDDSWSGLPMPKEYKFIYANGHLEVSPVHSHDELAEHAGVDGDHTGPFAVGHISVTNGNANWQVDANVSLQALHRVLKDYSKNVGWRWGGMTDGEGQPISDEFAPKVAYGSWMFHDGDLVISRDPHRWPQWITTQGRTAYVHPSVTNHPTFVEWATDFGYKLAEYPGGTTMDPDIPNMGNNEEPMLDDAAVGSQDERQPSGLWKCPSCGQLLPNWHEYIMHRQHEEGIGDAKEPEGGFPEIDMGATFPTHFTEMQPSIHPLSHKLWVAFHYGDVIGSMELTEDGQIRKAHGAWKPVLAKVQRVTAQEPKDMLEDPIPFIYDVDTDEIFCGNPGERTSDVMLPGKFTPGGIIEGFYEPGGKVIIRTMTNMPYTVRHMVELWYYQHPEFTVKSVHLQDAEGKDTKLAAQSVGGIITSLVASDPMAHTASSALMQAGGQVFAVGGAVRDAVLGKAPKDIDLMVTGLPSDAVRKVLERAAKPMRASVVLTGKDFGVYRIRRGQEEVEISLPRRERSMGAGHKDFDVQADHTMTPEEDFARRDFTVNAMGVNLANGRLVDPFGGTADIGANVLRTVHPNALAEDPLRVLRGVVAHAKHGLEPDPKTYQEMAKHAPSLSHLPADRLREELDKIMSSDDPVRGMKLAHETGVLRYVLPEVDGAFGFDQKNPHHNHDLGTHLLEVLAGISSVTQDPDVRLAALLHDIGKPASQWIGDDGIGHYYRGPNGEGADHDEVGSEMSRSRLGVLHYPNDRIQRVSELVQHHMFPAFSTTKGARKFLANTGPHADDLLTLRQADMYGKGTDEYQNTKTPVDAMRQRLEEVRSAGQATDRSALAINGRDLIGLGLPPGPQFTSILNALMEKVIEDPSLNERETLLTLAQGMLHA